MATNDNYATYKCKQCDSEVKEIPLRDHWDEHVLSRFKCLGCGLDIYDYDDNFDDYIKTTYHDV